MQVTGLARTPEEGIAQEYGYWGGGQESQGALSEFRLYAKNQ